MRSLIWSSLKLLREIAGHRFPCTEQDYSNFAAYYLQATWGDFNPDRNIMTESELLNVLPKHLLDSKGLPFWSEEITKIHQGLKGEQLESIRELFFNQVRGWSFFGTSIFHAQVIHTLLSTHTSKR